MTRSERRKEKYKARQRVKEKIKSWGYGIGDLKRNPAKPPGYEYWSRRPGPITPGKESKRITHGIERARAKEGIE